MTTKLLQKFKLWVARRTEQCKDISPLFSDQLDRKLRFSERIRVKLHLWTCGPCKRYVSNLSFMHDVFQPQRENIENEQFQMTMPPEAKERLKKAIQSKI
jgi:hypothetical protein